MAHDDFGLESHDDHESHDTSIYTKVFIALCVLTTLSFITYFDFWRDHVSREAGWTLMMAVSCSKALLVMLFFMHLKYEASWKYVLTIPASVMALFLMIMLVPDVMDRNEEIIGGRRPSQEKLMYMAEPPEDGGGENAE